MVKSAEKRTRVTDDDKLFAFIATFLSIIGFIIAIIARRDNEYVMFYAKQSLVIFIIGCVAGVIKSLVSFLPIMGVIIGFALAILIVGLWIISFVYSVSGEKRDIPFVELFTKQINL